MMMKSRRQLFAALVLMCISIYAHAEDQRMLMKTSLGDITLELYRDKAPQTVENFLVYADDGFYDGTIFHRVIDGFMIQGGGLGPDMQKKPTREPVVNEANNGLKNVRGSIAMARTGDPHSATAQFFINHSDNDSLDYPSRDGWGYTVFGRVVSGMDVVDAIAEVPTGPRGGRRDVPDEIVLIESVKRVE
jgi:peptidyl-prolyl cis-trans isomerase A (cyclophilin A)